MWNVDVEEVLSRWVGSDIPEEDDTVLLNLIKDAILVINLKVEDIDNRILTQANLQDVLNMVVAQMVQRAYNSDYSTYNSASYTTGPFSESFSKGSNSKQGIYLLPEEYNLLNRSKTSLSRISVISNPATPNFYVHGYHSYYWDGELDDCW